MSDTQAINIIEDAEGEMRVSTSVMAQGMELEHRQVIRAVRIFQSDLEQFGRVDFENQPFETLGGTQHREIARLNEHQATFLLTSFRNIGRVKEFKVALVKEFYRMRQALSAPTRLDPTTPEGMRLVLQAATTALAELEVAKPKADAWDELASADGDYEVADAAKILARAGIETGRQRLFGQLEQLGWIYRGPQGKWKARQSAVDSGYLAEKPQSHHHPRTGELVLDPPQVRVTVKGLERLRVRLGSVLRAVEVVA